MNFNILNTIQDAKKIAQQVIQKNNICCFIKMFTATWCGPCQATKRVLYNLTSSQLLEYIQNNSYLIWIIVLYSEKIKANDINFFQTMELTEIEIEFLKLLINYIPNFESTYKFEKFKQQNYDLESIKTLPSIYIIFCAVDVDENPTEAQDYNIQGIPQFFSHYIKDINSLDNMKSIKHIYKSGGISNSAEFMQYICKNIFACIEIFIDG